MVGDGSQPIGDLRSLASTQARILAARPDSLEPFRTETQRVADGYNYRIHLRVGAEHSRSLSDDFVQTVAFAGSLDDCRARHREILAFEPDRVSLTLLTSGREQRLERIAALWQAAADGSSSGPDHA